MLFSMTRHSPQLGIVTYSTTLIANGENVKVVQELMRHANSRYGLDIYSQA